MDKDFYTLKEVLFGLRAEQLRIEKELFSLERMLKNYNDKRYEGSHFLTSSINNYQELYYKLMINYSLKEKICSLFINKVNLFNYLGTTLSITKNNKEEYSLMHDGKDLVIPTMKNAFSKKVCEILNHQFLNEFDLVKKYQKSNLDIRHYRLLYDNFIDKLEMTAFLKYTPKSDSILVSVDKKHKLCNLKFVIDELLSCKIPRIFFSDFLQNIIDNNSETKKEVIIDNFKIYSNHAEFYINDERDAFILVKKK